MIIRKTLLFVLFLYGSGQVMATKKEDKEYMRIRVQVEKMMKDPLGKSCLDIAQEISASRWFISSKRRDEIYKKAFGACAHKVSVEERYGGLF